MLVFGFLLRKKIEMNAKVFLGLTGLSLTTLSYLWL